jgi:hypothetical protein
MTGFNWLKMQYNDSFCDHNIRTMGQTNTAGSLNSNLNNLHTEV